MFLAWMRLFVQTQGAGLGENRRLGTDDPVEFEKQPVEVRNFRRITGHSRGIYRRIYLKWLKQNQKMSTGPTMTKNFPSTALICANRLPHNNFSIFHTILDICYQVTKYKK